jgi:hypothetical protein
MNFSLKPDKTFYLLLGTVTLSVLVTGGIFLYQQQALRQRNQFLEEWHRKNAAALNECKTASFEQSSSPTPTPRPKVFTQRSQGQIHQITANPNFSSIKVKTFDMETDQEVLNVKDLNPFNILFQNYRAPEFSDVVLARDNESLYAILTIDLGLFGHQLFLMQTDQYNAYARIEALKFYPQDKNALCGLDLIDYFPQQKQVLLSEGCSDGCGGSGTIKLLSNLGIETKLMDYAAGCVRLATEANDDQINYPQTYLGYVQGRLYFGEIEMEDDDWEKARLTRVYGLDPLTRIKQIVEVDFQDRNLDGTWQPLYEHLQANELALYDDEAGKYYALDVMNGDLREFNVDE